METDTRVSRFSHLLEARYELRKHLVLETVLIERICELPEDNFCHQAREALQLGAGYAYSQRGNSNANELEHVFDAFFATQPRNRYLDEEIVRVTQQRIVDAALEHLEDQDFDTLDPIINHYTVAALAAFIEGYRCTRDYFVDQDYTSPTSAVESA